MPRGRSGGGGPSFLSGERLRLTLVRLIAMSNQRQPRYHFLAMYAHGPRSALYREYQGILRRIPRKSRYSAAEVENTLYRALHPDLGLKDAAGKPMRTAYQRRFHDLADMERYLSKVFFNAVCRERSRGEGGSSSRATLSLRENHILVAGTEQTDRRSALEVERLLDRFLCERHRRSRQPNERAVLEVLIPALREGEVLTKKEIIRRSGVEQSVVWRWLKRLLAAYPVWLGQAED